MDFRLKAFRSAAKNLSFTKASRELYISQPAVTKHIQALESEYGVRLFNRSGNKIYLTHEGKAMLKYADDVYKQHSILVDSLNQFKRKQAWGFKTRSQYDDCPIRYSSDPCGLPQQVS